MTVIIVIFRTIYQKMDEFITNSKARYEQNFSKCLVVGNVCSGFGASLTAISFAFYMQNRRLHVEDTVDYYIPVVNICRDLIDTRTDVLYYLDKFGVKSDDLLCLDDINEENFDMFILVDCTSHCFELNFDETLVKIIFDKTEGDLDWTPAADCEQVYKPAKSIATVVADYIVRHDPENLTDDDKLSLKILYDAIIYQTHNCLAGRSHANDIQMVSDLEGFLGVPDESYRETLLKGLMDACSDFSKLNTLQLLYKYSATTLLCSRKYMCFIFLPIGIKELIAMPAFRAGVLEFAEWMNYSVLVIVGNSVDEQNNDEQTMAMINIDESCIYKKALDYLVYKSDLKLSYRGLIPNLNGKWYRKENFRISVWDIADILAPIFRP